MKTDFKAAGRHAASPLRLLSDAQKLGVEIPVDQRPHILEAYKKMVAGGADFTLADTSFHLFLLRQLGQVPQLFEFISWRVTSAKVGDEATENSATLKMKIGGELYHNVADGNGPVNALDNVLRETLSQAYPQILKVRLTDYHVSIVNTKGTESRVLVLISFSDGKRDLITMGVGENISDASWLALLDAYTYEIVRNGN